MQSVSIIIPAYNEEAAIRDVIGDIVVAMEKTGARYEIIVVDDGSDDHTPEVVSEFPAVRVIRHKGNRGTGASRTTGLKAASYDIVAMIDADGTYPAHDVPRLLDHIAEYDMVIGARVQEQGTLRLLRRPAKWFIRKLASFITETDIPDLNSGLRAFNRETALKFLNILPATHSWVSTITLAFISNGYEVKYIPVEYYKRVGKSSFHPIRDTYNYLMLVIRTVMYFNPLKFFIPLSLTVFFIGIAVLVQHIVTKNDIGDSEIMAILTSLLLGAVGILADLIVKEHKVKYMKE